MNKKKESIAGVLFALPWIIGFSVFLAWPLIQALYYSLCDYSVLTPPVFIGLKNYTDLFQDELFYTALYNTLYFALFSIPLGTIVAIGLAMLLNTKVKGQAFYRTFFFLPALIPAVPLAMLWQWIFNGESGIINAALRGVGFESPPNWLGDPAFAKTVLIVMAVWTVGNAMVIYLAGLQEIPKSMYEAADLDGANPWKKTMNVTVPLLSPVITFNVIMAIIGTLQYFTQAYVIFPGGAPAQSTYLYTMYLYDTAFRDLRMGYASAMGWILFLIILGLTYGALKYSEKKVHYET